MSSAPHTERPWGKAMDFLVETAAASAIPADTTLYLFGSALRRQARPEDLDVLLVYPDGCLCQAHVLAESLRNAPTLRHGRPRAQLHRGARAHVRAV